MSKPESHDACLAALPAPQRAALVALAARIDARLPGAERCISYAMPALRIAGTQGSTAVVAGFAAEGVRTSKSGVLFVPGQSLSDWAPDAMIAARRAEIG